MVAMAHPASQQVRHMTHLDVEADPKSHDSLADRTSFGWPGGALPPTEAFHVAFATALKRLSSSRINYKSHFRVRRRRPMAQGPWVWVVSYLPSSRGQSHHASTPMGDGFAAEFSNGKKNVWSER